MRVRIARPPAPYFIVMRSSSTDCTVASQVRMSAGLRPDLARAFAADHAGAYRRIRHALPSEEHTVGRRFDSGHDVAAEALLNKRRRRMVPEPLEIDLELPARVELGPFIAQAEIAVRHMGNASPTAANQTEHFPELFLRSHVTSPGDAAREHVLDRRPPLPDHHG